jgi:uncharacterized protein (UPF0332 family)
VTSEQSALLQKAQSSLSAAQLLIDQGFYDFAASRAYYAMFYIAEAFLLGEKLTFSKHSAVIAAFGKVFAKSGRVPQEFHRFLIEGENSRNVSDYDAGPGLSKDEAAEQIKHAEEFLTLAQRLIGPIPDQPTQT